MALRSRTARRLSLAILLTAVIPLVVAILMAKDIVERVSSTALRPEVGLELERSLEVYRELADAKKAAMRSKADAIAARQSLRVAAQSHDIPRMETFVGEQLPQTSELAWLGVTDADGDTIVHRQRKQPINEETEYKLEVRRPLSDAEDGPMLLAVFVTPKARFDQLEKAAANVKAYRTLESERGKLERANLYYFVGLLAITIVAAVALATLLARSVTRRIALLAQAAQDVAKGDLSVRVPVSGRDEITDLARTFNRMVLDVEQSRARIEFLQRMGTWQEMARRLAHEIKNPLTPIQLAVEEVHWRYPGDDENYKQLMETTLKVVTEEVGTLRRLVTEFSAFARLPRADLSEADLCRFVREQKKHMALFSDEESGIRAADADQLENAVDISWDIPQAPLLVFLDKQMMHRVLVNLVRNAAQAIRTEDGTGRGRVRVGLVEESKDWVAMQVDDDGPGIAPDVRDSMFDPYVTTKTEGTGLGLSIVKKIVMEHGGSIDAESNPWGGARIRIRMPRSGTAASAAARDKAPLSSSGNIRRPTLPFDS